MIDLTFVMKAMLFSLRLGLAALSLLGWLALSAPGRAWQAETPPAPALLLYPPPGEPLRGSVQINGLTALPEMQRWELAFGYSGDPTGTWFLLSQSSEVVIDGPLYQWDTTTITDGVYTLRLEVFLDDGRSLTALAPGLRVRNYTSIETSTPTPLLPTNTPAPGELPPPTLTPTPTITPIPPTPTPLPTNPAELAPAQVASSLAWGAGLTAGLFVLLALYLALGRALRR